VETYHHTVDPVLAHCLLLACATFCRYEAALLGDVFLQAELWVLCVLGPAADIIVVYRDRRSDRRIIGGEVNHLR